MPARDAAGQRSALNEAGADADRAVYCYLGTLMLLITLGRTVLREGDMALAAKLFTVPLASAALLALTRWQRRLYVRHREAFCLAYALQACWVVYAGALEGQTMISRQHGGSPSLLLLLMMVQNTGLSLLLLGLGRPHSWLYHACLPLVMLPWLLRFKPFCERLLQEPGTDQLLYHLRDRVSSIHSPACLAVMVWPGVDAERERGAIQTCQELNIWSSLLLGLLLPVTLQAHMASMQRRQERWPAQSAASLAVGTTLQLVMGSALLWTGTTSVLQLLGPHAPPPAG